MIYHDLSSSPKKLIQHIQILSHPCHVTSSFARWMAKATGPCAAHGPPARLARLAQPPGAQPAKADVGLPWRYDWKELLEIT